MLIMVFEGFFGITFKFNMKSADTPNLMTITLHVFKCDILIQ